ncbi:unnamed protein product [marine sediment metagenome]|uniref:Uncharacterized protein n=1 Tax=marine sediment metagenome TaxID=412755 RepID=X1FC36_9ZZZZ
MYSLGCNFDNLPYFCALLFHFHCSATGGIALGVRTVSQGSAGMKEFDNYVYNFENKVGGGIVSG